MCWKVRDGRESNLVTIELAIRRRPDRINTMQQMEDLEHTEVFWLVAVL
jgi:hypothetical protein